MRKRGAQGIAEGAWRGGCAESRGASMEEEDEGSPRAIHHECKISADIERDHGKKLPGSLSGDGDNRVCDGFEIGMCYILLKVSV